MNNIPRKRRFPREAIPPVPQGSNLSMSRDMIDVTLGPPFAPIPAFRSFIPGLIEYHLDGVPITKEQADRWIVFNATVQP